MTINTTERPVYPGISAKAFQHPADRAATAALGTIPFVETILKKISEIGYERAFEQEVLANAVRIDERQLPEVYLSHLSAVRALDLPEVPRLFVAKTNAFGAMNALTVGSQHPFVVLEPSIVRGLSQVELDGVIAHENGHVLADHVHYSTLLVMLQNIVASGITPAVGALPLKALVMVLLEWQRCAELSSDRAAALVVADPLIVCRTLMGVAGGGVPGLDLDAFLQQASDYVDTDDLLARPGRFFSELTKTHPYPVRRVHELMRWVREGEFDRIRRGSYVHRGDEPPPTKEFIAATEHYRKRFNEVLGRVSGGVQKLASQLSGWLRGDASETTEN